MTLRPALKVAGQVALLTLVHLLCQALAGWLILTDKPEGAPAPGTFTGLLVDSLAMSGLTTLIVLRSRGRGPKLALSLAGVLFGVRIFMAQIETLVFPAALDRLPPGEFIRLWPMGLAYLAAFVPLAVRILGRWKGEEQPAVHHVALSPGEWGLRLVVLAVAYVAVYWLFGYYVAWQVPALREYYSGSTALASCWEQIASSHVATPWLSFFQLERGVFWALLAVPLLKMSRGGRAEAALTVGLTFAIALSSQLLLPGPHMPEAVRIGHLWELLSSMLLFGSLAGWVLTAPAAEAASPSRASPVPTGA